MNSFLLCVQDVLNHLKKISTEIRIFFLPNPDPNPWFLGEGEYVIPCCTLFGLEEEEMEQLKGKGLQ